MSLQVINLAVVSSNYTELKCSECGCNPEQCKKSISPYDCPNCTWARCCCWGVIHNVENAKDLTYEPKLAMKLFKLAVLQEEDVHNEFKASWTNNKEVDGLYSPGEKKNLQDRKPNASSYVNLMKMECARTVCGFLNGKGGNLWIGVSDQCRVSGIEDDLAFFKRKGKREDDVFRLDVSNYLAKYLKHRYPHEIEFIFHEMDEKKVFQISVKPLDKKDRPAYMHEQNRKIPFVREDEHDIPYNDPEHWVDYVKKRFSL